MSLKVIDNDGELRPAPRNLSSDLFIEFERKDEQQIMAEIQGAAIEEFIYEFKQGGQTVTGLSLSGVMAVAQNLGGITMSQPVWSESTDHEDGTPTITCDISATDHKTGMSVWGDATQRWFEKRRDGSTSYDKFARSKALSKAQRNAVRKLIPEKLATQMIRHFREGNGGQPASARSQSAGNNRQLGSGSAGGGAPMTPNQRKYIESLARDTGLDRATLKANLQTAFGSDLPDLMKGDAGTVIEALQALKDDQTNAGFDGRGALTFIEILRGPRETTTAGDEYADWAPKKDPAPAPATLSREDALQALTQSGDSETFTSAWADVKASGHGDDLEFFGVALDLLKAFLNDAETGPEWSRVMKAAKGAGCASDPELAELARIRKREIQAALDAKRAAEAAQQTSDV